MVEEYLQIKNTTWNKFVWGAMRVLVAVWLFSLVVSAFGVFFGLLGVAVTP